MHNIEKEGESKGLKVYALKHQTDGTPFLQRIKRESSQIELKA